MPRAQTNRSTSARSSTFVAWILIALGTAAVVLGAWDLLVERDGETFTSLVPVAIGGLVVALGLSRRRAQLREHSA